MTKVEIITIGDELLIGQVIDTNSAWMAQELNKIGFDVEYKTTIGDNEPDILDAFETALGRASVILVTGGIGPTKDDITKKTLCRFFNTELVFDPETLKTIENVLSVIKRPLNSLTKDQALVPEMATIIQNQMGTAPVTWFDRNGKILVSMPGVPYEMKWIMTNEIIPRLKKTFQMDDSILHQSFWVKNYGESALAMKLDSFENELPESIKLAYLPTSGLIRLRLTGKSSNKEELLHQMQFQKEKLTAILQDDIVSEDDDSLEIILGNKLIEKKLTLSLAESCTGGKLASLFTEIPGASSYFKGGAVTYSNDAKINILNVNPEDITKYGAVSKSVVEQMASNAQILFGADCSMATSGIAGPDGGTPEKPVGTVWIAVKYKDQLRSELFQFSRNRESNILRACNTAMRMLLELVS